MKDFKVTSGALPGSEKIYVEGSRKDIKVPMRKIPMSPTLNPDGQKEENEDIIVYDTSGPYTDPDYTVNLHKGLPKLRRAWIEEREDTCILPELSSEYGKKRLNDKELDHLRFEHVNTRPRAAKNGCATQMHYARRGIITPEMEFAAIRENQLIDRIKSEYRIDKGDSMGAFIPDYISPEFVRSEIAAGRAILPTKINHTEREPTATGRN